jgi:hypothetical protein
MSFVNYKGYTREMGLTSVGPGWAPLVNRIFDKLESITGTIKIVQVKEKFAGLRVYTDYINEELEKVINEAERESFKMCEECGKPGKVRGTGWMYTSCDEHVKNTDAPHDYQPGDPYVEEEVEEEYN